MEERYYIKVSGSAGAVVPHNKLSDAYIEAQLLFALHFSCT